MKAMLIMALAAMVGWIGQASFADEAKAGKILKSIDGTYEVEVAEGLVHRCGKDGFFMDYIVYDSTKQGCAITYKKLKCNSKENPCPADKWETIQEEKVIATAKNSTQYCKDKVVQMTDKFKTQGFDCKAEGEN